MPTSPNAITDVVAVNHGETSREPDARLPLSRVGIGLAAAGAALLGLAINSTFQPDVPPYERVSVSVDTAVAANMGLADEQLQSGGLHRLEWRATDVRNPVASALVMKGQDRRLVALDWQNSVTEPVFSTDLSTSEVSKVLTAIREHVAASATVLAWWDMSRKIRLIAQRAAPLDDPQARGLMVPSAWTHSADKILANEQSLWGEGVPPSDEAYFSRFIDALLMDEHAGAAALRELASDGETYVAVHLSDIWKAASARPNRIAIAYRDFPGAGLAHGVIKAARQWMNESKMDNAYAVEPIGNAVRLHYLTNKESAQTLLTKLLPFSESNPMLLSEFELVYQHRGFWIYRIKPKGKT